MTCIHGSASVSRATLRYQIQIKTDYIVEAVPAFLTITFDFSFIRNNSTSMKQISAFFHLVLAWSILITRSSVNGCFLKEQIKCTVFPDDPFNYDCTPKPSIEIHTLKLLQKNVLQSPNKILGCSTFHIIFKGLQEYKISEGPLERSPIWMPERPIVIIGAI
ncbi:unnamed protein product [Albugo candida]|uniref:Uncharacterized protein n=1 Tax=Albugo candida TaxID=65357 RepID=A0A024GEA4_9STRA|nr:unnamed protein product [Albugo candida]|eukprot:CCI44671.1 unnamed protein product [Albugo candida]